MKRYYVTVKEHSINVHIKISDFRTLHIDKWNNGFYFASKLRYMVYNVYFPSLRTKAV
jgi:hypothetical protein